MKSIQRMLLASATVLLLTCSSLCAQEVFPTTLVVVTPEKGTETAIELGAIQKIVFTEGKVKVSTTDTKHPEFLFPLENKLKMYFSKQHKPNMAELVMDNDSLLQLAQGPDWIALHSNASDSSFALRIYNMAGRLVLTNGNYHIDEKVSISTLPMGIYFIQTEQGTYKFIKQ